MARTQVVAAKRGRVRAKAGTLLGRFAGKKLPTDEDIREVRSMLWKRLDRKR